MPLFPPELTALAARALAACEARGWMLAAAESCTGGLLAGCLTDVPGSSAVLDRGVVSYSNAAKTELLGVPVGLVARHGAVSAEVALAMASGALDRFPVDLALSITGIAGPGGGSAAKPVGLVFIGWAVRGGSAGTERHLFSGDRGEVRLAAVKAALEVILRQASA